MQDNHIDCQRGLTDIRKRAVLYTRISSWKPSLPDSDNSVANNQILQEMPLKDFIASRGWQLVRSYADRACGTRDRRPAFYMLMQDVRIGAFDVVVFHGFDRLARSLKLFISTLALFHKLGIDVVSVSEGFDTTTEVGAKGLRTLATLQNIDRNLKIEQIQLGMELAQQHGSKSGRPIGRPRIIVDSDRIVALRREGKSWQKIAGDLRVSPTTARRVWEGTQIRMIPEHDYSLTSTTESDARIGGRQ